MLSGESDPARPLDARRRAGGARERASFAPLGLGAGTAIAVAAAAGAGAILRVYHLPSQVPFGDELHAVRVVAAYPLREILTRWFESDPSPPLAACYSLLLGTGAPLDETWLRLPLLLCGMASLLAIPLLLLRLAPRLAVPAAWLVALSPCLVLYSRIARPYMAVALLGFLAAVCFLAWWRRPAPLAAAGFVTSAGLAVWLFLGAAPFFASFFVWAAGAKLLRRGEGPRWRSLFVLGLLLSGAIALFLVPAWSSFVELLRTKPTGSPPGLAPTLAALQLLAGARSPAPAVLFWVLVVAGAGALLRRSPAFATLSALAFCAQLVAMAMLAPVGLAHPVVFARYLLVALPLVLCCAAAGLVELADRSRRFGAAAGLAAPSVALLLLVLGGPLVDRSLQTSSFLASEEMLGFHVPRSRMPAERVPSIYERLARELPPGAVLEYTGSPTWSHLNHLIVYQEIHRRRVMFAPQDDNGLFAPGIALRNLVRPLPDAFSASAARYLVVHRHTARELARLERPGAPGLPPFGRELRRRARLLGERMARRLTRLWGPPLYLDDDVAVWDLDAVRALPPSAGASRPRRPELDDSSPLTTPAAETPRVDATTAAPPR
jgi:hypothetical protein